MLTSGLLICPLATGKDGELNVRDSSEPEHDVDGMMRGLQLPAQMFLMCSSAVEHEDTLYEEPADAYEIWHTAGTEI